MWDFEFTDTDPLDPVIEEEIKEDPDVFKRVYMQLLTFSNEDDDNTQVLLDDSVISFCFTSPRAYTNSRPVLLFTAM